LATPLKFHWALTIGGSEVNLGQDEHFVFIKLSQVNENGYRGRFIDASITTQELTEGILQVISESLMPNRDKKY
jgi:hypothetical protein